jgi:hypothetical protein
LIYMENFYIFPQHDQSFSSRCKKNRHLKNQLFAIKYIHQKLIN